MKQLCYYILAVALIFGLCFLIVRSQRPQAELPTETGAAIDTGTPATGTPDVPASGSDLYLPEPFSERAQAALDALYDRMRTQSCQCALAWLGTAPEDAALAESLEQSGMLTALAEDDNTYAFLPELTPADCGAGGFAGLYCLLPPRDGTVLQIRAGDRGLYQGGHSAPVLFTADSGEVQLSLRSADGETWELSVMLQPDGCPVPQPELLDFSK